MTVVVYRDGIMAADRMVSTETDLIVGQRTKIIAANGMLAGGAGASGDLSTFLVWIKLGRPKDWMPTLGEDFSGLLINPDGTGLRYNRHLAESELIAPYYAIGGGAAVALGALYMGATAEQAVKAACTHAIGCGGGIDILKLGE